MVDLWQRPGRCPPARRLRRRRFLQPLRTPVLRRRASGGLKVFGARSPAAADPTWRADVPGLFLRPCRGQHRWRPRRSRPGELFLPRGRGRSCSRSVWTGQISRIWFAKSNDPGFVDTRIQFFFDGADQVSYEIPVTTMMSGTAPPFVAPLVLNADRSSGGWISYVPLPFHEGVKVRLIGAHVHYRSRTSSLPLQATCRPSPASKTTHWHNICGSASDGPGATSRQPDGNGHRADPARRQPGAGPNEQLRRAQQPAAPTAAAGTVNSRHTTAGRYGARPSPRWSQLYVNPAVHQRTKPAAHPSELPRYAPGRRRLSRCALAGRW